MAHKKYDAIVVGAGINGLTCAAMLAKRGKNVLVAEQREVFGGMAAVEEFHPGYNTVGLHHDTSGVRPGIVDSLNLQSYGVTLQDKPADIFVPSNTEENLLLSYDRIEGSDSKRYIEYREFISTVRSFAKRVWDRPLPNVTDIEFSDLYQLAGDGLSLRRLGKETMYEILRIGPMCVADWMNEWFESALLKAAIAAPAIYGNCMGPWSAGSAASLLRLETLVPKRVVRDPTAVPPALIAACKAQGVELRANARVTKIDIQQGEVHGVTLNGEEMIDATHVISSLDIKQTFLQLISSNELPAKLQHRVSTFRSKGVTAKVNLALNQPIQFSGQSYERIRIVETLDQMEKAFDATKYGQYSSTPILDIFIPTKAHPGFAPHNHEVVSIAVHFAPYDLKEGWNDRTREALGNQVLRRLEAFVPGIGSSVLAKEVLTPLDIENRYGTTQGHIFHGDHALDQLLVRPIPECSEYKTPIRNLFLCGSSSHPGGGLTCAPGALCAQALRSY